MASKTPFTNFEIRPLPKDLKHWRNGFDSRFLRVFALNGSPKTCLIKDVGELYSSDDKGKESKLQLLITLAEFDKPWAINVTNSETIAQLYGDNPSGWIGKRVTLYPTKTKFGRETVDCIRVRDQIPEGSHRDPGARIPGESPRQQMNRELREEPPPRQEREPMRPEVAAMLERMANAGTVEALDAVQELLVSDNSFDEKETGLLARALGKRRSQLAASASA